MVNKNIAQLCGETHSSLINTEFCKEDLGIYSRYAREGPWERKCWGKPSLWYSTNVPNDREYRSVHMYRMTRIQASRAN